MNRGIIVGRFISIVIGSEVDLLGHTFLGDESGQGSISEEFSITGWALIDG